jgi:arylsulfatase A-like enzyme
MFFRPHSLFLSLALIHLIVVPFRADAAPARSQPNILFIFADDQSHATIHALGNDEIWTPHLDTLVSQGTAFTNVYNMGGWNGAICIASRTMLNTGRSLWRAHSVNGRLDELAQRGQLWSLLLSKAGYTTYNTGKWHIEIPPESIFDHQIHERPGMPRDHWNTRPAGVAPTREFIESIAGYNRPIENVPDNWAPDDPAHGGFWEGGKHWSEVLADDAEQFLKAAATDEHPFFMYLAFNAPHDPRQAPKRFVDLYPRDDIAIPETFLPLYPFKDAIGCVPTLRDEALAPFPRTPYAIRAHRQEYYAIISHMDEQIGRILDVLEATGQRDNTYIIFTADHGLACGNHGLLGKQNMYDHSMKPPLIIVGPDIPQNERRDALVYLQDIMPTSLELAGVAPPEYVDFNSLLPLIRDKSKQSLYPALYGAYLRDAQRMIRKGNLKLIVYPGANRIRLYDLAEDPKEMNDLSEDPQHLPVIKELFRELLDLQVSMDDTLDLRKAFPRIIEARENIKSRVNAQLLETSLQQKPSEPSCSEIVL